MDFSSNIKALLDAAIKTEDPTLKAYLGLVAIELSLKVKIPLKNHDVPNALKKYAHKFATNHKSGCKLKIDALSAQLTNSISAIHVQSREGTPMKASPDSYPHIRYTRIQEDGWPLPHATLSELTALSNTVAQIQKYLKEKFQEKL